MTERRAAFRPGPMMRTLAACALAVGAGSCAELTLAWAPLAPKGEAAAPALATTPESAEEWRRMLEGNVYGRMPDASRIEIVERRLVDDKAFGGLGAYEEIRIRPFATFAGVEAGAPGGEFIMALVTPNGARAPAPVIVMETFCPRTAAAPHPDATRRGDGDGDGMEDMDGFFGTVATYVFGRYICTPPYEAILGAGYAAAVLSPGDVVPDSAASGLEALTALSPAHDDPTTRWGAIAAWGWMFSRAFDALAEDPRIDQDGLVAWGHSRYAKAALVAAAYDDRIDAVVAHQSGTGGASLNWNKPGESVGSIVENYPHWFAPAYATLADASEGKGAHPGFDQHMLLALIAPRPVLLGNARRDVWSDPAGAFRAAVAARPAWRAFGRDGLSAARLDEFDPASDVAFWMRPGTHGVVEEDWPAFIAFLDAHLGASPAAVDAAGE